MMNTPISSFADDDWDVGCHILFVKWDIYYADKKGLRVGNHDPSVLIHKTVYADTGCIQETNGLIAIDGDVGGANHEAIVYQRIG